MILCALCLMILAAALLKAKGNEQTVVRSVRDVSIVYAVGEFLSNTSDHFNDCAKGYQNSEQ